MYPMERNRSFIFAGRLMQCLLPLLLLAACQRQETDADEELSRSLQVLSESPQPPQLEIVWGASDSLAVFSQQQSGGSKFMLKQGGGKARGRFDGNVKGSPLVALYPYSAKTRDGLQGKKLNLSLPSTQRYRAGGLDGEAYPMLGVSESDQMDMKALCGVLELSFSGTATLHSISLQANGNAPLNGGATAAIDFPDVPVLEMKGDGGSRIVLETPGVQLQESRPTSFFLVLPPGTYKGFTVVAETYSGTETYTWNQAVNIERAHIFTGPAFTCDDSGEPGPDNVPYNQIWYTTADGQPVTLPESEKNFDQKLLSNRYDADGWGRLTFAGPVSMVGDSVFENQFLTALCLPDCVSWLGERALFNSSLSAFRTPRNLNTVGRHAFGQCDELTRFYGPWASEDESSIILEDGLLAAYAPGRVSGRVEIPQGAVRLADYLFFRDTRITELVLPEGLTTIGENAFWNLPLLESVILSSTVQSVGRFAFAYCRQLGSFQGSSALIRDGGRSLVDADGVLMAVAGKDLVEYSTPADATMLGSGVFVGFDQLRSITFTGEITNLYSDFLSDCRQLEFFYGTCTSEDHHGLVLFGDYLARTTPVLPADYTVPGNVRRIFWCAFEDNATTERLVIPDEVYSIGNYCFRGMSKLQSLQLPASLQEVGGQAFRSCNKLEHLYLRGAVPPGYPEDDEKTFFGHSGLTIHVPAGSLLSYRMSTGWSAYTRYMEEMQYGDLPDEGDYSSTDFSRDGTLTRLQTAKEGNGINIVLLGDAFSDRQVEGGVYRGVMQRMAGILLDEEPFASYPNLFNIYAVDVVSPAEGYRKTGQALGTRFEEGNRVSGDDDACKRYALKAVSEEALANTLIVVAMNSDRYAGTCRLFPSKTSDAGDGMAIAYVPLCADDETFRQVLLHEALGHGFAKLADEYAGKEGAIPADEKTQYTELFPYGWWKNIDFTGDAQAVKWAGFLQDSRYAAESLGCYEGACEYLQGVWRPSAQSIMRYNEGGFNAPSREAIWYRMHKLAYGSSWEYDREDFVRYDAVNRPSTKASVAGGRQLPPLSPPQLVGTE